MKKMSEIIGLRIVTIDDGLEVGIIRSVIINSSKGKIEYFATEKGISLLKAKVADAKSVEGIGDYAMTIKSKEDVFDISAVDEALDLVYKGVEIIGNRVISRRGKLLGEAVDLVIDEENNCLVSSVQIISNSLEPRIYNVAAKNVITYGQNFLVIDDEEDISNITNGFEFINDSDVVNLTPVMSTGTTFVNIDEKVTMIKKAPERKNVSDLFDFKQRQFLKGKTCLKSVVSNDGDIIVDVGEIIDESIYDLVKSNGKIFELIKNLG